MTQSWNAMLMQMLWIVPIFLVCLFGLVLAISRWGRHPRAARERKLPPIFDGKRK